MESIRRYGFQADCEVCESILFYTEDVDEFLEFIEMHGGHGLNGKVISLQRYSVLRGDND